MHVAFGQVAAQFVGLSGAPVDFENFQVCYLALNLEQALEVVVKASAISVVDGSKLIVMLQSSSDDTDSDAGAPGAPAYGSQWRHAERFAQKGRRSA